MIETENETHPISNLIHYMETKIGGPEAAPVLARCGFSSPEEVRKTLNKYGKTETRIALLPKAEELVSRVELPANRKYLRAGNPRSVLRHERILRYLGGTEGSSVDECSD